MGFGADSGKFLIGSGHNEDEQVLLAAADPC